MEQQSEARLQYECYTWFWNTFPEWRRLLYHVPNGGYRSQREAGVLKATGVVPGIPDLVLAMSGQIGSVKYNALYIELKTKEGRVSPEQVKTKNALSQAGNLVKILRSFEEFLEIIFIYCNIKGHAN